MKAVRIILKLVAFATIGICAFLNNYAGVVVWFTLCLGYVIGSLDNEK